MGIYTEQCCQPAGSYDLVCKDSYGDGWHGGYLLIEGKKYCKRFKNGHEKTEEGTWKEKILNQLRLQLQLLLEAPPMPLLQLNVVLTLAQLLVDPKSHLTLFHGKLGLLAQEV